MENVSVMVRPWLLRDWPYAHVRGTDAFRSEENRSEPFISSSAEPKHVKYIFLYLPGAAFAEAKIPQYCMIFYMTI
jgi:hypothetical protein